jgi:hypothetical protein
MQMQPSSREQTRRRLKLLAGLNGLMRLISMGFIYEEKRLENKVAKKIQKVGKIFP